MKKHLTKIIFILYLLIAALLTLLVAPSCTEQSDDMLIQANVRVFNAVEPVIGRDIYESSISIMWTANTTIKVRWKDRRDNTKPVTVIVNTRPERQHGEWSEIHRGRYDFDGTGEIDVHVYLP